MPPQEPSHLKSTLKMLRAAFPEGIDRAQRMPVMRALYDHMSDRNIVDVMRLITGEPGLITINDVYKCAQMDASDAAVVEVVRRLHDHGFAEWQHEP